MRRAAWAVLAVAACGKKDEPKQAAPVTTGAVHDAAVAAALPPPPPTDAGGAPIPTVRFAIANGAGISTYETGAKGLTLLHSAKLIGAEGDYDLVWTAPDALYVRVGGDVSRIVDDALVPVALPPKKAFATKHEKGETRFEPPRQKLFATATGELWFGRCAWGDQGPEEESCNEWMFARLAPAPVLTRSDAPERAPDVAPPEIAPPSAVTATLELEHVIDAGAPDDRARDPQKILRCTVAGKTTEWPAPDDREAGTFVGMSDLVWLSADPPIFAVDRNEFGLDQAYPSTQIFQACSPVHFEGGVHVVYGPDDVLAIVADGSATVRWHGHAFTPIEANDLVFAPAPAH